MYVIKRIEDGAYVSPAGSKCSYTLSLQLARTFVSRDAAKKECCGNEFVVRVDDEMRRPS